MRDIVADLLSQMGYLSSLSRLIAQRAWDLRGTLIETAAYPSTTNGVASVVWYLVVCDQRDGHFVSDASSSTDFQTSQ